MKADHGKNTSQQRRRCLHLREKKRIGAKIGHETPRTPQKNRGEPGKKACKSGRREDNHENGKKQFIYAMNNKSNGKSRIISVSRLSLWRIKAIATPLETPTRAKLVAKASTKQYC
jgi:hypothetical protein